MNPAAKSEPDPLAEWISEHPRTIGYIAVVVTFLLVIQIGELLS